MVQYKDFRTNQRIQSNDCKRAYNGFSIYWTSKRLVIPGLGRETKSQFFTLLLWKSYRVTAFSWRKWMLRSHLTLLCSGPGNCNNTILLTNYWPTTTHILLTIRLPVNATRGYLWNLFFPENISQFQFIE